MKEVHGSQDSGHDTEDFNDCRLGNDEVVPSHKSGRAFSDVQSVEVEESSSQLNESYAEGKIQAGPSQENHQALSDVQSVEIAAEGFSDPPDDHYDEKIRAGPSQENLHALSDVQSVEIAEGFSDPPDDHGDEKIRAGTSQEHVQGLSNLQRVEVAEGHSDPSDAEIGVGPSHENIQALSDLQSVEVAGGHTEPLCDHHQEREIAVTDTENSEVLSNFPSHEGENTLTNRDNFANHLPILPTSGKWVMKKIEKSKSKLIKIMRELASLKRAISVQNHQIVENQKCVSRI